MKRSRFSEEQIAGILKFKGVKLSSMLRLCELERIDRERRNVERRIRLARFPQTKSLDTFDFAAQPSLNKALVLELTRCECPKSAIRFLFTQTLPAGRGIFSPFCVSERAPPVRYALRRQFRSHPQAFWGVLAAAPPLTPSSWRQRRRECRTRDHDVSGMTHPSCMKRTQRSRIAVNTASMAELIFKNVCLPCRTILPAV